MLNVYESLSFLRSNRLPVVRDYLVKTEKELKAACKGLKYPLAMKINSPGHKSDSGGVVLNINSLNEALKAFKRIRIPEGVLVQEQVKGIELIVGIKKDPVFGQVLLAGMGGVFTEVLKDVSFRVCPFSKKDAREMLQELKSFKVLQGYRGKSVNLKGLINLLVSISKIAVKKDIKEMDINPLIASGNQFFIVDARLSL